MSLGFCSGPVLDSLLVVLPSLILSADLALLVALGVPNQNWLAKFLIRNGLAVLSRKEFQLLSVPRLFQNRKNGPLVFGYVTH
jgi:hypothetical protein